MEARRRLRTIAAVGILAAAAALVLWLSPEDRTLGVRTKLVFFHGALIIVSLLLYAAAGFAALVYLVRPRERTFRTATVAWLAAVAANAVSLPTGLYAAQVIWGGILWSEPRVLANAGILFSSLLVAGVGLISVNRRGIAFLHAAAAVLYAIIIRQAGRIMHPANPIGRSDSWTIKLSFVALLALVLALTVEALRPFLRAEESRETVEERNSCDNSQ